MNGRVADQVSVNAVAGNNRMRMDYRESGLPTGIYMLQLSSADGAVNLLRRVSVK